MKIYYACYKYTMRLGNILFWISNLQFQIWNEVWFHSANAKLRITNIVISNIKNMIFGFSSSRGEFWIVTKYFLDNNYLYKMSY